MQTRTPLAAAALYRSCEPDLPPFETTAELPDLTEVTGQARAVSALRFGVGIRATGYNLFLLGSPEVDKRAIADDFLRERAARQERRWDWCYVHHFADASRPRLLRLPAGRGSELRDAMRRLVDALRVSIPAAFESTEYRRRIAELHAQLQQRGEAALAEIQHEAEGQGAAVMQTPHGFVILPAREGRPRADEEIERLPEEERARIRETVSRLERRLAAAVEQFPEWFKEHREKEEQLNREATMTAVGLQIAALRKEFGDLPEVADHLAAVEDDLVENAHRFLHEEEGAAAILAGGEAPGPFVTRYGVNLLVDDSGGPGAPVVYESNPTYPNLVGHIDHRAHLGALLSDFTLIRAGALHRASGGYLVLDAERLLTQPFAWQGLKRALFEGKVRIEALGELLGLMGTVSLEPEPMPLDVKVVLVGDRLLYYLLHELDPDFPELFKVVADFEDRMDRSPETITAFARLLATAARKEGLRPLHRGAVARLVEQGSRLACDAGKLSLHTRRLADLLREASYWAGEAHREVVSREDVQTAIDEQVHRLDRVRQEIQEAIQRQVLLIATEGEAVGQVNGVSVSELGGFAFGHPVRITATARLGNGEVIDVQREIELGGPIHSKGVLTLASFLGSRYAGDLPLSLSASLVFEQTYERVEGDSASVAEACALLSVLARTPVRQALAVTGSMNQHGAVQAVGGVNEKIEGFFDACRQRGLTGEQGVLIPADNVQHLMLRDDVVQAVREGKFAIYPLHTIDEAIALLTGTEAGERDYTGSFPLDSLNQRVELRLRALATTRLEFLREEEAEEVQV